MLSSAKISIDPAWGLEGVFHNEMNQDLWEIIKSLKTRRPRWDYRLTAKILMGGHSEVGIYYDGERLGRVEVASIRMVAGGSTYKYVITGPTLQKKEKGDEARRTERLTAASTIVLDSFRPKTPDEIIGGRLALFRNVINVRVYETTNSINSMIYNNNDEFILFAKDYTQAKQNNVTFSVSDKLEKIIFSINELEQDLRTAEAANMAASSAVFVWKRPSGWQVIEQNTHPMGGAQEYRYKEFDDIPENIRGKLAVLSMQDVADQHYTPGVGFKIGSHMYWIFP